MHNKKYKNKYDKKINKRDRITKKLININWIIQISIIAFIITTIFSSGSDVVLTNINPYISIIIAFLFVFTGVLFDMIGISVARAEEKPFHSMSSKKIKGAKIAVKLIKNAEKVSAFCADVIGDVCGVMSGSAGIVIATSLSEKYNYNLFITTLIITGIIAATTVGGKAIGKSLAINKSEVIVYKFSKFLSIFEK